jgi:hypothetical protein
LNIAKGKLGHCENQNRPLGPKTGQHPSFNRHSSITENLS